MNISLKVRTNFKTEKAKGKVRDASGRGLLKVTTLIAEQTKKPWPEGTPWLTGNNSRSIEFDCDKSRLKASIYSTSGYGGFLEVGTVRKAARPYMKPALDKFFPKLGDYVKEYL